MHISALMWDGPVPLPLSYSSLLLSEGPWLELAAAKKRVNDGTARVDPSGNPEDFCPAGQSALPTRGEDDEC